MVFSGILFTVIFLPLILVIYQSTPKSFKNLVLLFGSVFFYSWGEPVFVFILLAESIVNYYAVLQMNKQTAGRRKHYLFAIISFNLAFLLYFKYFNFFIETSNDLLNLVGVNSMSLKSILLPIGISFFTFQSITYAVDVYRKTVKPQPFLHNYILYCFLFPHLIAGPIVKYHLISEQISSRKESSLKFLSGFTRFSIGLAKKVLIANALGDLSKELLETSAFLHSTSAWIGMLAYTFQIYFDFSGYSDMAIGLGKMFGFDFPENFDRPYTSRTVTEFWKKWHITLGDFMKNYLYIPLGGNKFGSTRMYFNLLIVFFLSGLWHGANWTFVLWGLFHGTWMILEKLFLERTLGNVKFFSIFLTFIIILHGWVLFRSDSMHEANSIYAALWNFNNFYLPSLSSPIFSYVLLAIALIICVSGLVPGFRKLSQDFIEEKHSLKSQLITSSLASLIFFISLASIVANEFNPFIYFKF